MKLLKHLKFSEDLNSNRLNNERKISYNSKSNSNFSLSKRFTIIFNESSYNHVSNYDYKILKYTYC